MAVITKIEEQKNKKRVNIFVDDAFFCGISKETAVVFRFKVGSVVNENKLLEAVHASEVNRAFEKASDYLGMRMHSKKELVDKLLKKGFDRDVISEAVAKLEEYHFVDDELMAKTFVEQNGKYSRRMLENKLKAKGVDGKIAKETALIKTDEDEFLLCKRFAQKHIDSKGLNDDNDVKKLFASLLRKGFTFDTVKKAVYQITHNEIIENLEE